MPNITIQQLFNNVFDAINNRLKIDVENSALPSGAATSAKQDDVLTKVGEVQASPTANTVLARLKDIKDGIPLTGRKAKISDISVTSATTVNAAASEEVTINPTSGYLARVLSMYLQADGPSGATSGTHQFEIYQSSATSHKKIVITAAYNVGIRLRGFDMSSGTLTFPSAVTELPKIYELMKFNVNVPLKCKYTNNTNANQTASRIVAVVAEEEAVV